MIKNHGASVETSLRQNYSYNTFFQIFILIFPLITIPIVAKALGPQQLGTYLFSYSIAALFGLISNLGIVNYGNKIIAANRDSSVELAKNFTSLYVVSLLMTIPALALYLGYCLLFVEDNLNIFLLQGIFVLSTLFDISWFYMGSEKFKLIIKRDILLKCITLACILLFVRKQNGLIVYTTIMATAALISKLVLWPTLRRYTNIVRVSIQDCKAHVRPLFALFIPVVAVSLYTTLNIVILGSMTDLGQVGQFNIAIRIMGIPLGLITAMGVVMLPRMSYIIANKDERVVDRYIAKSMSFVMFMSLPVTFGLIAVSTTLVPLFLGKDFRQAGIVLAIVAPVLAFAAWASVLRTQYLIPKGKNKSYIISVLLGAVISLSLNLLLIPGFKSIGAAIAMVCAEFSVMFYQSFALRGDLRIRAYLKSSRAFLFKALIMFAAILLIGLAINQPYIRIILQITIGGFIYATLNLVYLDKTILNGKIKHPIWRKLLIAKERLYAEGDDISGEAY
jgi:O-antigen/teichoic acid export membrane protein